MAAIRVQLSRKKGWKMPPNTVKVDRTTLWGNPYRAGIHTDAYCAVDAFRYLLTFGRPPRGAPEATRDPRAYVESVRAALPQLRGKNLACWCSLESPCHAEVLLEFANRPVCDDPVARSPEGGTDAG